MRHDEVETLLEDYADGTLPRERVDELEAHLESCVTCRRNLASIRSLLEETGRLPRSIEPPRDLWPEIEPRLSPGIGHRTIWSLRYPLAAAAVLLIAVSAALTVLVVGRAGPGGSATGSAAVAGSAPPASWRVVEESYLVATAQLREALEVARGEMDAETAELIEANLRIIDSAIQESRAALALDPGNRELMAMLSARYEQKIEVLQQASRMSARL